MAQFVSPSSLSNKSNKIDLTLLLTERDAAIAHNVRLKEMPKKIDHIGEGAYGKVYSYEMSDCTRIAGKKAKFTLFCHSEEESEKLRKTLQTALNEVKILKQLDHDRIINFIGCNWDAKQFIIFTELMEGSVKNRLYPNPLTEIRTLRFVIQAAQGLSFLHNHKPTPILHRDIKCDNLLLDSQDNVKLADFGIALRITLNDDQTRSGQSTEGWPKFLGTLLFAAPEVRANYIGQKVSYGRKADIWSLACTIVEMLTGKPPHSIACSKLGSFVFSNRASKEDSEFSYSGNLIPNSNPFAQDLVNYMFIKIRHLRPGIDKVIRKLREMLSQDSRPEYKNLEGMLPRFEELAMSTELLRKESLKDNLMQKISDVDNMQNASLNLQDTGQKLKTTDSYCNQDSNLLPLLQTDGSDACSHIVLKMETEYCADVISTQGKSDLATLHTMFEQERGYFRVLFLQDKYAEKTTPFGREGKKSCKEIVKEVLCDLAPDIIIYVSNSIGSCDYLHEQYAASIVKEIIVFDGKDVLEQIDKTNMQDVALRKKSLFLNLEGNLFESSKILRKFKVEIHELFGELFQRMSPSDIAVSNIMLSSYTKNQNEFLEAMYERIIREYERKTQKISDISFTFIGDDSFNINSIQDCISKVEEFQSEQWKEVKVGLRIAQIIAPMDQVASKVKLIFGDVNETPILIPIEVKISKREYAIYSTCFELYHKKIGEHDMDRLSKEELETLLRSECEQFLQGWPMNPTLLFLNNFAIETHQKQMYVTRPHMTYWFERLKTALHTVNGQNVENNREGISYVPLYHEPSSGGSTIAKYVLYQLREEFPCISLSSIDDEQNTKKHIIEIYNKSKRAILILCDSPKIDQQRANKLRDEFIESRQILRCVIFHVQHVHWDTKRDRFMDSEGKEVKLMEGEEVISLKLNSMEIESFRKIFAEVYEPKKERQDTVYLYGALAFFEESWNWIKNEGTFLEEYKLIDQGIDEHISGITEEQEDIVLFCCLVELYTDGGVDYELIATMLNVDLIGAIGRENKTKRVLEALGNAQFLFRTDDDNHNNVLISFQHSFIPKKLLERKQWDERKKLEFTIDCLTKLGVDRKNQLKKDCTKIEALVHTIEGRNKDENENSFSEFYEQMIESYRKGDDWLHMVDQCKKLREAFKNCYALIKCARILMYFGKREEAFKMIRLDFGLHDNEEFFKTTCVDTVKLSIASFLIMDYTLNYLRKSDPRRISYGDQTMKLIDKVKHIYVKPHPPNGKNKKFRVKPRPHVYCYELQLRYNFINSLHEQCGDDNEQFLKGLNTKNVSSLSSIGSVKAFFETLNELEILHRNGRMDRDYPIKQEVCSNVDRYATRILGLLQSSDITSVLPEDLSYILTVDRYLANAKIGFRYESKDDKEQMNDIIWRRAQYIKELNLHALRSIGNIIKNLSDRPQLLQTRLQTDRIFCLLFQIRAECRWSSVNKKEIIHLMTTASKVAERLLSSIGRKDVLVQFLQGALKLLLAIMGEESLLRRCDEDFEKNIIWAERQSISGLKKLRLYIAENERGAWLDIVPPIQNASYEQQRSNMSEMKRFNGHVTKENEVLCDELHWDIQYFQDIDSTYVHNTARCTFGVALHYTGFIAYDLQFC